MKKRGDFVFDFILRYLLLIIIGIFSMTVFYFIFTSATIYPVYYLLQIFFNVSLESNIIWVNNLPIEIIGACVAASAYYLLLVLNLSTGGINLKKRIGMLLFSFSSLLVVNILRIFLLSVLFLSGVSFFDTAHKLFWYLGSVLFVVGIWFLTVKIFRIKEVPLYSDMMFLLEKKKRVRRKRH